MLESFGRILADLFLVGILLSTAVPLLDHHFAEKLPHHGHVYLTTHPTGHVHSAFEPHLHRPRSRLGPSIDPNREAIAVVSKDLNGAGASSSLPALDLSPSQMEPNGHARLLDWPRNDAWPREALTSPLPPPPRV